MSRVGKQPITIPDEVNVDIKGSTITVKGSKGELTHEVRPEVEIKVEGDQIAFSKKGNNKDSSALWGTTRAVVANMIKGVTDGYEKKLKMVGVGYRAKKSSDQEISMTVGFSHPVEFKAPEGVKLDVEEQDTIIVSGIDKQLVGQTAAKIRAIRKPEPYKGKGIRYEDEIVRRKPGKVGKVL